MFSMARDGRLPASQVLAKVNPRTGTPIAPSVLIGLVCIAVLAVNVGNGPDVHWLRDSVRYGLAYLVLVALYALMYGWLPDIRQRIYTVLPGALVGAAMWVGAAAALSYTLRTAGKLALLYGSFAGVVATLVFLYISATTLIFGAEINGVLRNRLEERKKEAAAEAQPA